LPALDARVYVEGENLLGVALSVLMRIADEERPWLKARAMQRIATAPLSVYRRFVLAECVEAYGGLEGPRLAEFEKLLLTEEFKEAQMLAKTSYEKGIEKGLEQGLEKGLGQGQRAVLARQLERRFGPLSAAARARLEGWQEERLLQLADDLLTPKGLAELGLEDAPNGAPPQGS
jgi:flagellar biosynthesis/type III secretory pathway protein FliH